MLLKPHKTFTLTTLVGNYIIKTERILLYRREDLCSDCKYFVNNKPTEWCCSADKLHNIRRYFCIPNQIKMRNRKLRYIYRLHSFLYYPCY